MDHHGDGDEDSSDDHDDGDDGDDHGDDKNNGDSDDNDDNDDGLVECEGAAEVEEKGSQSQVLGSSAIISIAIATISYIIIILTMMIIFVK